MAGISKDVVESFLKKLSEEDEFPENIITKLRFLLESDQVASKEKIFQAINEGLENNDNNQTN